MINTTTACIDNPSTTLALLLPPSIKFSNSSKDGAVKNAAGSNRSW